MYLLFIWLLVASSAVLSFLFASCEPFEFHVVWKKGDWSEKERGEQRGLASAHLANEFQVKILDNNKRYCVNIRAWVFLHKLSQALATLSLHFVNSVYILRKKRWKFSL